MPATMQNLRILVVDDNPHMLKIVRTILNGFGVVNIFEAQGGHDALHIAQTEPLDIIIADYQMEPMDGLALVRKLRSDDMPNPLLPIIMLSAYSERRRVLAARDAGATEFCCKPVTARDVFRKIAAVVDHPRPFVRTKVYFGPDRRRHDSDKYKGPKRRSDDDGAANEADAA